MSSEDVTYSTTPAAARTGEQWNKPPLTKGPDMRPEDVTEQPTQVQEPVRSFWRDRSIEAGLLISMGLYYLVGNSNLAFASLDRLPPLLAFPFLAIFCVLCWYRLPFALGLLPVTLPFYAKQKALNPLQATGAAFSLAEIILLICLVVGVLQLALLRKQWSVSEMIKTIRERLGPFIWPILLFVLVAAFSIIFAYNRGTALRAFRQEIIEPVLYLLLILGFFRRREDLNRLIFALLGVGALIAFLGVGQYAFFHEQMSDNQSDGRVHAIYGSANSVGLFLNYILPLALTLAIVGIRGKHRPTFALTLRVVAGLLLLLMLATVVLSQSLGTFIALAVTILFLLVCMIRNRRILLISGGSLLAGAGVLGVIFRDKLAALLFNWHVNSTGIGTLDKRLYLWRSASQMIQDRPFTGFGLDNWLCYYSVNTLCPSPNVYHYGIFIDPSTGLWTGLQHEKTLSHPHDIFLHIWVSMGVFGVIAFIGLLVLCFWLFARLLKAVRADHRSSLNWLVIGVGASLIAAMTQGLIDSAFLEQDLSYCFWTLVASLLVLRAFAGTGWGKMMFLKK